MDSHKSIFEPEFREPVNKDEIIKAKVIEILNANKLYRRVFSEQYWEESLIGWSPPPALWVKINTNGGYNSASRIATTGVLLRDDNGNWILGFSYHAGSCSITKAKMWGALVGLGMRRGLGYKQVLLELESQAVIHMIKDNTSNPSANSPLLGRIRETINRSWIIRVNHVHS